MNWQAWYTLGVLTLLIYGLIRYAHLADVIFVGALALLGVAGIVAPKDAMAGFANDGVITIAALFVVGRALIQTGMLESITQRVLGGVTTVAGALRRVVPTSVFCSAFLNNTTIVAMGMPALVDWARKRNLPVSSLLLPLSYASLLGGVCTLIGTSTNLVVHGIMKDSPIPSLRSGIGMWEIGAVGVPLAIIGAAYLILFSQRIVPARREFLDQVGDSRREFLTELLVETGCPLIGKTVQDAGLRGLGGLFLVEIDRGGELLAPVRPEEKLLAGDRLVFTGVVTSIAELKRVPGLVPAADLTFQVAPERGSQRRLSEAVISASSPLIGTGIRQANFRGVYDAVVVAVHRNGRRLGGKIGDVELEAGDTLLLETGQDFFSAHRHNPDFYLVSDLGETAEFRPQRAWLALLIGGGVILAMTLPEIFRWFPAAASMGTLVDRQRGLFALLAASLLVATRCLSAGQARKSIEWSVLIAIAASLGVGKGIEQSGLAQEVASVVIHASNAVGPLGTLGAVWLMTWILTELMSNNAAAALMMPIGVAAAQQAGVEPRPFAIAIAIAASASFVLPAGYQTHLMVFGPGGYRVSDFVRAGAFLAILWFVGSIVLIPVFWPLSSLTPSL